MELRKTLCHPYLVDEDLEPRDVSLQQAHQNLTDACAKFVLLARMLPKLKAAGHRVLIFSQFKLTLNVLERFLGGLDLKFLRLDGDTPQLERQRDVDRFNAPGSDIFAYLLSTRAGGVGLNITSADVVIMFVLSDHVEHELGLMLHPAATTKTSTRKWTFKRSAARIASARRSRCVHLLSTGRRLSTHSASMATGSGFQAARQGNLRGEDPQRRSEEARSWYVRLVAVRAPSVTRMLTSTPRAEHLIIQRIDAVDESEDMESMLQVSLSSGREVYGLN